jgi:protein-tyrosine phosphatase
VLEDSSGERRVLLAAERHLPLQGARNFRDLGGYRAADGRHVRWGRVFRSDQLSYLTGSDLAYLERIGIQAVCDLRGSEERRDSPDRLPALAAYHTLPIYENQPRAPLMNILLFRRHLLGATLERGYIDFLEHGAPSYGQLLRLAVENPPIVYHCAAGKDRAGIATALLLALLGVPDETILADYSLSNLAFDHFYDSFVREDRLRRLGVPNEQVQALFVVEIAWLEGLLAYLRETYGTVENYLIQKAGLDEEIIARLRASLLE